MLDELVLELLSCVLFLDVSIWNSLFPCKDPAGFSLTSGKFPFHFLLCKRGTATQITPGTEWGTHLCFPSQRLDSYSKCAYAHKYLTPTSIVIFNFCRDSYGKKDEYHHKWYFLDFHKWNPRMDFFFYFFLFQLVLWFCRELSGPQACETWLWYQAVCWAPQLTKTTWKISTKITFWEKLVGVFMHLFLQEIAAFFCKLLEELHLNISFKAGRFWVKGSTKLF